jgi:hypothetical protein
VILDCQFTHRETAEGSACRDHLIVCSCGARLSVPRDAEALTDEFRVPCAYARLEEASQMGAANVLHEECRSLAPNSQPPPLAPRGNPAAVGYPPRRGSRLPKWRQPARMGPKAEIPAVGDPADYARCGRHAESRRAGGRHQPLFDSVNMSRVQSQLGCRRSPSVSLLALGSRSMSSPTWSRILPVRQCRLPATLPDAPHPTGVKMPRSSQPFGRASL